jgi:hypothetical protein
MKGIASASTVTCCSTAASLLTRASRVTGVGIGTIWWTSCCSLRGVDDMEIQEGMGLEKVRA